MSIYRDDLAAARERIEALETELRHLQRKNEVPWRSDDSLVQPRSSFGRTALALGGVLLLGLLALRITAIGPLAAGSLLLLLLILSLRGRTLVVRPHEVAMVTVKQGQRYSWVAPGRTAQLRSGSVAESFSLRAIPIFFEMRHLPAVDTALRVEVFAVVGGRLDEEGIERAVQIAATTPMEPVVRAALQEVVREVVKDASYSDLAARTGSLRERLRRECRESLHRFGVEVLVVGWLDVREEST
ncbi:MAG TPA: SPFH domain-containing protein [Polyangiaceae bacterium]|jgi:hypothetical protein|nr:MAG: hypothetical protein BWY17_04609 [Deltaproteobacteria bacterium ADurb.Bin207]HNS98052.1 SPFH domain-containing protein [Polyangiaceae bacterium]HNZ24744.1 SPFH domain-containing protein [Polyangiaceae bacterium]HOD24925.1 SPFH domain-containing protein [Polyangiaceae bacterium]HOE51150.1 SPFH domain-containing protein [Polyangiaceae bacterium]